MATKRHKKARKEFKKYLAERAVCGASISLFVTFCASLWPSCLCLLRVLASLRDTSSLLHRGQEALAKLAVADEVVLHRREGGQVGVVQHKANVVRSDRLPLVQADQDVATCEA